MNKEEIYKKNQKRIKALAILSPIVFWVCLALAIVCFCSAIGNSMDNVNEIYNLLDSKVYNDTQLADNYQYLINKYGKWVIGQGTSGFTMVFVNFKGAIFSGFVVLNAIFSAIFLVSAFLLGKWLLPSLKKKFEIDNQDMVNLTILKNDKE